MIPNTYIRADFQSGVKLILKMLAKLRVTLPWSRSAFGVRGDTGWFRLSAGAVSMDEIREMFPRIRAMLDEVD
ncbi:MAG: hypothetical protein WKF55_13455 [Gemmatimonadaceae bacterium]